MRESRDAVPTPPAKTCPTCGRNFEWRRKWALDWDSVRYCSSRCRRGPGLVGREAEQAILDLLAHRSSDASICPSEAARALAAAGSQPDSWRSSMPKIHDAARRLAVEGRIEITQGGRVLDPTDLRGPVRLRRPRR